MNKKISILIIALVVILAVIIPSNKVFAASKKVNSVEVTQANGKVTVSGTVESGMLAVAVQVLDSNGNLVKLETGAVDADNKYKVEIKLADGQYTIKVADYDGGEVATNQNNSNSENSTTTTDNTTNPNNETSKETTVIVNNSNNPSTGDKVMTFVGIFAAALAIMIIALIFNKSKSAGKH